MTAILTKSAQAELVEAHSLTLPLRAILRQAQDERMFVRVSG